MKVIFLLLVISIEHVVSFWDMATTTPAFVPRKETRKSRFWWQETEPDILEWFFPWWNWWQIRFRRRMFCVAGLSHKIINLTTAVILNRRTLITSANVLDPYMDKQTEVRIWALGRGGNHDTPFRYRVWRITRLFPRSLNPEHCHGPFCYHSPRHDIALVHSLDQMYIYKYPPTRFHYAYRGFVPDRHKNLLTREVWSAGTGFKNLLHIAENYKVYPAYWDMDYQRDCSKYLPKWWGKFICFINYHRFPGIQNGMPLFNWHQVVGIGCFEIRYNEDRIVVFTDVRYYVTWIYLYAHTYPNEYYEYAYPQWGARLGLLNAIEGWGNEPYIPQWQAMDDLYPMGKK